METKRIIGIAVLAIGVALLFVAYHASNAPLEKLTDTITGRYSDGTMWYFATGIAATIGGGLLAAFGSRK